MCFLLLLAPGSPCNMSSLRRLKEPMSSVEIIKVPCLETHLVKTCNFNVECLNAKGEINLQLNMLLPQDKRFRFLLPRTELLTWCSFFKAFVGLHHWFKKTLLITTIFWSLWWLQKSLSIFLRQCSWYWTIISSHPHPVISTKPRYLDENTGLMKKIKTQSKTFQENTCHSKLNEWEPSEFLKYIKQKNNNNINQFEKF